MILKNKIIYSILNHSILNNKDKIRSAICKTYHYVVKQKKMKIENINTLGELKESGYKNSIKEELRSNLRAKKSRRTSF
jgi:hypothetical protein